jgi:hypothetical protein
MPIRKRSVVGQEILLDTARRRYNSRERTFTCYCTLDNCPSSFRHCSLRRQKKIYSHRAWTYPQTCTQIRPRVDKKISMRYPHGVQNSKSFKMKNLWQPMTLANITFCWKKLLSTGVDGIGGGKIFTSCQQHVFLSPPLDNTTKKCGSQGNIFFLCCMSWAIFLS